MVLETLNRCSMLVTSLFMIMNFALMLRVSTNSVPGLKRQLIRSREIHGRTQHPEKMPVEGIPGFGLLCNATSSGPGGIGQRSLD